MSGKVVHLVFSSVGAPSVADAVPTEGNELSRPFRDVSKEAVSGKSEDPSAKTRDLDLAMGRVWKAGL